MSEHMEFLNDKGRRVINEEYFDKEKKMDYTGLNRDYTGQISINDEVCGPSESCQKTLWAEVNELAEVVYSLRDMVVESLHIGPPLKPDDAPPPTRPVINELIEIAGGAARAVEDIREMLSCEFNKLK